MPVRDGPGGRTAYYSPGRGGPLECTGKGLNTAQRELVVSLILLDGSKGNLSTAAETAEWRHRAL